MKYILRGLLGPALLSLSFAATADFHLYKIDQLYSNADGTVQYLVMHETTGTDGENLWSGNALIAMPTHGGTAKTFVFPQNLPGGMCTFYYGCAMAPTAFTRVLIATEGFAALGLVKPDYTVPNGFFATNGVTINYSGTDQVTLASIPTDGTNAVDRNGTIMPNLATNFAGQSASVKAATMDLNQHGLTGSWYEAVTSGQGVEVEVFPNPSSGTGSTFVSWFTYDTVSGLAERQRWYTAQGPVVTGQPNASLTIYQNTGGNFNAAPVTNAQPVGTATLSFDTCSSGQLSYSFTDGTGRTGNIPLTRLTQNVTCSTATAHPTNADFAFSGNWYDAATSGQGLTVEVNPNSGTVFLAWYTYAPNGVSAGAAGQRWYTAQPTTIFAPGSRSIDVTIYETTGGMFDQATPPGQKTVPVGTGTLAFQSCSAATFSYNFTGGSSSGQSGKITLSRVGPVPPGCTS
jgi:hypothetical protein